MTLANMKIGRKLCVGFACVLLVVALMSAGLIASLKSLDAVAVVARDANAVVDEMDLTIAAAHEESRASLRFLLKRNERFVHMYDDAVKSFAGNPAQARSNAAGHPGALALIDKVDAALLSADAKGQLWPVSGRARQIFLTAAQTPAAQESALNLLSRSRRTADHDSTKDNNANRARRGGAALARADGRRACAGRP